MSTRPTILLVHGFWGGAAHWRKVIVELSSRGYQSIRAVENPLTSLADDAKRTRQMIAQQKGPMFLMSGSGDTIATPGANQQPVFEDTNVPVFWGTLQGATHTGTALGSIGGYRGPATAWFRLHLMGDESARSLFYGASCGLCADTTWSVQRKGIQ